ncbi:phosphoglycerol transferase MdoB-like AlkP superfamily enzyme [Halomonas ventosae]|uniref:Phosphoglycerol transferase MdoB-like AlkP superfamily enzyme n=1 Tax=Halomonas ventosae TaxID=229007 RepID=A0A4R6ZSX8_9GAMM|nr:sulfatase-like hydrolase/transferase [Halomonas ventosae]TDR55863.1 phosphoglycerol transferase MdoB-like AlkP superfamily enzyme [Halomonas ventosae]
MPFRSRLRWFLALALLNGVLLAPVWLLYGELTSRWIALEAILLAAGLSLLPSAGRLAGLRWLVVALLMAFLLVGLGDVATHLAFGRSLNLYLDLPLLRSVFHLLEGNLGFPVAGLLTLLAMVLLALATWLLAKVAASLQGTARSGLAATGALGVLVASGMLIAIEFPQSRLLPVARTPLLDTLHFQGRQLVETHRAHRDFAERMAAGPDPVAALPGLAGRDVVLVFVESYGISALLDDRYARVLGPRLEEMAERFADAGLSVASGILDSPIRGGQSWLAHATALSGLRVDNSLWYRLMLGSERTTLVDDFRATGHRTLAVMPAITMAWPEGRAYGFDEIHAAADLEYAGPPLNWVTMPDQYTLHHFQARIRQDVEPSPLFAQIALISSHAPWTPILPVLDDWDAVGDGSVFARWEDAGESPDELWQDLERVRDHYARSLDYALGASIHWAEDFVDDQTLVILLGDHQAAPLITGDNASGGVPVHVISGDARLLDPFLARGFVSGTRPPRLESYPDGEPPGQEVLRGWLHEAFGAENAPGASVTTP